MSTAFVRGITRKDYRRRGVQARISRRTPPEKEKTVCAVEILFVGAVVEAVHEEVSMHAAYTQSALQALHNLRSSAHFSWYLIPMLAFVFYVYFNEVERKNWNLIMAGLAFSALEWFLEIGNALWFHFSRHAAVWMTPGDSAYIILIGLTIEISLMFAVAGVIVTKVLPEDRDKKILGLPNRWFFVIVNSLLFVFIEVILNQWGVLVWEYRWWNWPNVWLIIIIGYSLYMIFAYWIHDMESMKKKVAIVAGVYAADVILIIVFMGILKWI